MDKPKLMWQIIGRPVECLFETIEKFTLNDQFYRRTCFVWYGVVLVAIFAGYHATPTPSESTLGFWSAFWHGLIAWHALVISLFVDSVSIYSPPSGSDLYNWGFLSGVSLSVSLPYQRQVMKWRHKTGRS